MDVGEMAARVSDRDSFLAFVQALIEDREDSIAQERTHPSSPYGPDANGWENATIEAYLGAALAWARDTPLKRMREPSWRAFAVFLHAGKTYE